MGSFLVSFYNHFTAKQWKWSENEAKNELKMTQKWLPWTTLIMKRMKTGRKKKHIHRHQDTSNDMSWVSPLTLCCHHPSLGVSVFMFQMEQWVKVTGGGICWLLDMFCILLYLWQSLTTTRKKKWLGPVLVFFWFLPISWTRSLNTINNQAHNRKRMAL